MAQRLQVTRARGLSNENVTSFYDNLEKLYKSHDYELSHIWNCDELGVQARRGEQGKILAKKGFHNVHTITPKEQEWFTIFTCINAKGASIPNFYIFKGKRMSRNYIVHYESGATRPCNPRPKWLINYFQVGLHILWNMWILAWMGFNLQINIFWSSMDMAPMWPLMSCNI